MVNSHSKTNKNLILFPSMLFADFRFLYWQVCILSQTIFCGFINKIQRLRPHKAISPNRALHQLAAVEAKELKTNAECWHRTKEIGLKQILEENATRLTKRVSFLWRHVDLCRFCTFLSSAQQAKGQIISAGLFGILKFSQKTNKQIRLYY